MELLGGNSMTLDDIIEKHNIYINNFEELLDYIIHSDDSFSLDLFPYAIENDKKYKQVEIFYQGYLDKDISNATFLEEEKKFHNFFKLLWLYDNFYVSVAISKKDIRKNHYARLNRKEIKNGLALISDSFKEFKFVDEYEKLKSIMVISTREIAPSLIYCEKSELLIYFYGCQAAVLFLNNKYKEQINYLAKLNNLFLL